MMRPLRSHLDRGPGIRNGVLGAVVVLVVLGAVGCSDVESTNSTNLPEAAEAVTEAEAVAASACAGAEEAFASFPERHDEEPIASGEAEGVCWWLFALPAPTADMTASLCVKTVVEARPHGYYCTTAGGAGVSSGGPVPTGRRPVLSGPSVLPADPPLIFGTIDDAVARVVVETGSGAPIEADVVGRARAHYVAVAAKGTRPVAVITYAADGRELDRVSLREAAPGGLQMSKPEIDCGVGADGSYECEGTSRGSAGGTMSVRCEEVEDGQMVCDEVEPGAGSAGAPASAGR